MNSIKSVTSAVLTMSVAVYAVVIGALMAPVTRMDQKIQARGEDPEAGAINTMEIVIMAAIVLAVVVTVAAAFGTKITSWFDKVPGG